MTTDRRALFVESLWLHATLHHTTLHAAEFPKLWISVLYVQIDAGLSICAPDRMRSTLSLGLEEPATAVARLTQGTS